MTHPYAYAVGVFNTRAKNSPDTATLADLRNIYKKPVVLEQRSITYHNLSKKERGAIKKELPYFVGGKLNGRRHDDNVQARTLITLDIEAKAGQEPPPAPADIFERLGDHEGWIYTSLSHTPAAPRYRVVLPLEEHVHTVKALEATTKAAAKKLGLLPWCTPESYVLSQPMFLPAKLRDGVFWERYTGPGEAWGVVPDDTDGIVEDALDKVADDPVLRAIQSAGLYLSEDPKHKGKHYIRCPWYEEHGNQNDTQTVYYEPHHDGNPRPAVKCFDTEPDVDGKPHLTIGRLLQWLRDGGWLDTDGIVEEDADDFLARARVDRWLHEVPVDRDWAWEGFAPVGKVTVMAGPGGVSKSMLILNMMVYGALGRDWGPFKVREPMRCLYVSYEDDQQELHKRVHALATALREQDDGIMDMLYDVDGSLTRNLLLYAVEEMALSWLLLRKPDRYSAAERTERVDWLVKVLRKAGIKVLILDPAVYTHTVEESDPGAMAQYMQTLNYLAKAANCAVVVVHHMHKAAAWATLDEINQGSLRGASSFADNSRSVGVLVPLPAKDAPRFALDPRDCKKYAVFKHVKHNYSAPLPDLVLERRGPLLVPRQDLDAGDPDAGTQMLESRSLKADHEARCLRVAKWLEENGAATQHMIHIACGLSRRDVKDAVEWLMFHEYAALAEGKFNGKVYETTKKGRLWIKTIDLDDDF